MYDGMIRSPDELITVVMVNSDWSVVVAPNWYIRAARLPWGLFST